MSSAGIQRSFGRAFGTVVRRTHCSEVARLPSTQYQIRTLSSVVTSRGPASEILQNAEKQRIKPFSGQIIKAFSSQIIKPNSGKIIKPDSGQIFKPDSGQIIKPVSGQIIKENSKDFCKVIRAEDPKAPSALVFGWAAAQHKHLDKYSQIYRERGFTTVAFTLGTDYVLNNTELIPGLIEEAIGNLLKEINIFENQVFIHCLSDAGVMMYQGLMATSAGKRLQPQIRGVVWDSCLAPYPEMTLTRLPVLTLIVRFLARRDGMSEIQAARFCQAVIKERGIPGLFARWRGEKMELSLIDGTWCGDWGREHYKLYPGVPEMFMYSNLDFYLRPKYLERTALAPRRDANAAFNAVKFMWSFHVSHLRSYPAVYKRNIRQFVDTNTKPEDVVKESLPRVSLPDPDRHVPAYNPTHNKGTYKYYVIK